MSEAINKARFVSKLVLRNTSLNDEYGIKLINSMDRVNIKHLDISYNPNLTSKFYEALCELIEDPACSLERIEIEGNMIGDKILRPLC